MMPEIRRRIPVDDGPERALEDWGAATGGDPADPQVVAFVEESADVVEWLADEFGAEVSLAESEPDLAGSRQHLVAIDTEPLGRWYGEWLGDAVRTGAPASCLVR